MKKTLLFISGILYASVVAAEPKTVPVNLPQAQSQITDQAPIMDSADLNFNPEVDAFGEAVNLNNTENNIPIKVNTRQSLTDNIKENAPENIQDMNVPEVNKNWVNQLITSAKDNIENKADTVNPLASAMQQAQGQIKRSNAAVFDISGVMLRMSYKQAEDALLKRGYKKSMQKMDVPNFIRWRNEEKCRNQGVIGYERIENCVIRLAQKEHYQFISEALFNKFDTKETVKIYLTSTFTNNKIYRITYRSEAANLTGNSQKSVYLRNIKVYDFWKKINQKYGVPDNKDDVIWGLGGNKPYMRAATGFLVLEDNMLRELDYTRMSREDQRFLNTDVYTF